MPRLHQRLQGGLGVIDIKKQNEALLMKNLDKFFNRSDIPWVNLVWDRYYRNGKLPNHTKKGSFWWRENLKNLPKFKEFAMVEVKDGSTVMLWQDKWHNQTWKVRLPELYSYAKNKSISAKSALEQEDVNQLFHLPISEIAFGQLQRVQQDLKVTQLNENKDIWKFNWGSRFQSPKAYKELIGHSQIHDTYKWLWDCFCQPKHKV